MRTKTIGIALAAIMLASVLVAMVLTVSAQAEGEGLNETAFWAFITIAVTVILSVVIAGIFHYLSTKEMRKMGTEIAVEMGKVGEKMSKGASEDIKTSSEQIQKRIAEDGGQTRRSIEENGKETRKAIVELVKSFSSHHLEDCEEKLYQKK
jgi:Na+/melibiose symporter-like transporter